MAPAAVLDHIKAKPKTRARPKSKGKQKLPKTPVASTLAEEPTQEQSNKVVESGEIEVQDVVRIRPIAEHQSFEVVQTLLHVSLAKICYLRDLLPDDGFEDRDYGLIPENIHWGYEEMLKNIRPNNAIARSTPPSKPSIYKILAQNAHPGAKRLTSWLDGIFQALSKKILAGVQLSVILDKDKPSSIVESYTFSIKYQENGGISGRQLEGLTLSKSQGEPITLKDAHSGLKTLVRHLIHRTENFPDLPPVRFLTVHIFYTEDSDPLYNPPLFKPLHDPSILVPHSKLWRMIQVSLGGMDFGYHYVGLQIGRLETVEDSGDSVPIPQNLQYTKRMLRSHNGIVDSTAQLSAQPSPAYTRRLSKIQDNRSVDNQHNLEDQNNGEEYTQTRPPPIPTGLEATQRLKTPQRASPTNGSTTESQSPSIEGDTDDLDRPVASARESRSRKRGCGEAQTAPRKSARIAAHRSPHVASKG